MLRARESAVAEGTGTRTLRSLFCPPSAGRKTAPPPALRAVRVAHTAAMSSATHDTPDDESLQEPLDRVDQFLFVGAYAKGWRVKRHRELRACPASRTYSGTEYRYISPLGVPFTSRKKAKEARDDEGASVLESRRLAPTRPGDAGSYAAAEAAVEAAKAEGLLLTPSPAATGYKYVSYNPKYGGTPFVARMPGSAQSGIEIDHFGTREEAALAVAREERKMKRQRDADRVPPARSELPPAEVDKRLFVGATHQGWRIEYTVCRRPEAKTFGKTSYVFIHTDAQTGKQTRFQHKKDAITYMT